MPHGRLIFALALAALAGGLVAFAHPLPVYATFVFVLALGGAIGANLSWEMADWADLTQTLVGAFLGTLVVLHFLTTVGTPSTDNLQIGVRVIGSWILASAIMARRWTLAILLLASCRRGSFGCAGLKVRQKESPCACVGSGGGG